MHTEEIRGHERSDQPQVEDAGRRRFLSFWAGAISALITAALAAPLIGMFLGPLFVKRREEWLALGRLADTRSGAPTKFTYSYIRTDGWFEKTVYGTAYAVLGESGKLVVFSNICTHLGCGVRWDPARRVFACPCHNGVFAIDGSVISGPPPRPLNRFTSRVARGQIEIRIREA